MPTATAQLVTLSVLGPAGLVPFAINRVGTSHMFLWAMGMVSALYYGMPVISGVSAPDIQHFWLRAVAMLLIAAVIGMFAGSVLSMIVLPTLASHAASFCTALHRAAPCRAVWHVLPLQL